MLFVLNSQGTPSIAKIIRMGLPLSIDNNSDDSRFFVQQHYYDFLDREPDQGGWDFWTQQLTTCIADPTCNLIDKRASVSYEFFNSAEFQNSGYFVYRMYRGALALIPTFSQFMPDRGQVIGGPNLEASKQAYADGFVLRPDFVQKYPLSMDGADFHRRANRDDSANLKRRYLGPAPNPYQRLQYLRQPLSYRATGC